MLDLSLRVLVGFLPVLLFLGVLLYLDSYKLVHVRWILGTILLGGCAAITCYVVNVFLISWLDIPSRSYIRYVAPPIEEALKASILVSLLRSHRIGFLIDAAIYGFAVGTGFAVAENLYYLGRLPDVSVTVWLVRGCGTAIMHGGTTAIFGIVSKNLSDQERWPSWLAYLPGFLIACSIHSVFNHFFLSPVLATALIILGLPPLLVLIFNRSERALESWLKVGFDADTELLELINSGEFSRSKVGLYLHSLKERFRGEVVADMLCYLRLHMELSLRAKGLLMMRESGFRVEVNEATREKFQELEYLEGSIGRTGKLAMAPFLHIKGKDLWQLYMLGR